MLEEFEKEIIEKNYKEYRSHFVKDDENFVGREVAILMKAAIGFVDDENIIKLNRALTEEYISEIMGELSKEQDWNGLFPEIDYFYEYGSIHGICIAIHKMKEIYGDVIHQTINRTLIYLKEIGDFDSSSDALGIVSGIIFLRWYLLNDDLEFELTYENLCEIARKAKNNRVVLEGAILKIYVAYNLECPDEITNEFIDEQLKNV